jgi:DNA repair protein RadC
MERLCRAVSVAHGTYSTALLRGGWASHSRQEIDPSKEYIDTTNKITQALKYVGIRVLDHIIVGRARQDYFSFARAGMV